MIVDAEVDAHAPSVVCPYPPTPQNSLFFYIKDPISVLINGNDTFVEQPKSVIVGPQLTRVQININHHHKAVRVGFHPGGLFRLLGFSLSEFVDGSYDADDVFGAEMKDVNEQLEEAMSFDDIKNVIEQFLLGKLKRLKTAIPFDKAILELLKHDGLVSMEAVASLACLSLRQFERISNERLGFPPKLFARLIRFSKAYRLKENNQAVSWTSIAHTCGYFDQMHLIRDFKQFAGVAPGTIEKELNATPVRLQAALQL
jgi:AraC-like DNA-binding protein